MTPNRTKQVPGYYIYNLFIISSRDKLVPTSLPTIEITIASQKQAVARLIDTSLQNCTAVSGLYFLHLIKTIVDQ